MSRERILGIPFFTGSVDEAVAEALRGGLVVAPSGPNLANELRNVPDYRRAVETADVALTDSAVMVAMYRAATGKIVPRQALARCRAIHRHHHSTVRQRHIRTLHRPPVIWNTSQFIGQVRTRRRDNEPTTPSLRHRLLHRAGEKRNP